MVQFALIPTVSYSFHHCVPYRVNVFMWLSHAKVVAIACTNWKCVLWLSLALIVRLLWFNSVLLLSSLWYQGRRGHVTVTCRSGYCILHKLEVCARATFGLDGLIAPIPTSSYSFDHPDSRAGMVTWLSRAEVVTIACTNWKCVLGLSLALMVWLLRFHCRSTPFITLIHVPG